MTRNHILLAVNERIPFVISTAGGESYTVSDESQIAVGQAKVIVIDNHDLPRLLPLLSITGLSYPRPSEPTA